MRINVYAEEITTEVEIVTKIGTGSMHPGMEFYGIRCYLDSPDSLHSSMDDDDRSAITFWVPWTKVDGYDFKTLRILFDRMEAKVNQANIIAHADPDVSSPAHAMSVMQSHDGENMYEAN